MKKFLKVLGVIVLLGGLTGIFIPPLLYFGYRRFIYISPELLVGENNMLIVFGAGVEDGDTPSGALQDRLDTAVTLYETGKVKTILVSGSKTSVYYNEPEVMKESLVKAGVPEGVILEDTEGMRTFDSCARAKSEFGIHEAVLVSQGFHLPRALFLCRSVGIQSTGVFATGAFSTYYDRWYTVREVLAMYKAVWDVLSYRL